MTEIGAIYYRNIKSDFFFCAPIYRALCQTKYCLEANTTVITGTHTSNVCNHFII